MSSAFPHARSGRTAVVVMRDRINLAALVPMWQDLARHALEPNRCYEHWTLLPALASLAPGDGIRFVLVLVEDGAEGAGRKLGAMFPFHAPARYKGLPVIALSSFRHGQGLVCTPLVRAGWAHTCFDALFDWFSRDGDGASLLELRYIPRDGQLYCALGAVLRERDQMVLATERFSQGRRMFQSLLAGHGAWGEIALSGLPLLGLGIPRRHTPT